ncbi:MULTISPECIES: cytochrome c biogenesis CcdA family protein [Glutamicibacter]|jgi:cytochrome c biogenesis protein CcdA|uniref:Cytochrome c biogenesis protein CcdA n=3 Tax=Glutamicibacter TaxID=1742989 RepID=A0A2N7RZT1_9MICC|nr:MULTISPECIES: cytochrome c biogenesis CcdA family protein [Glutamicibacter]PMQ19396.1 cytochrome c biogenesis protein CcdA [Glutamicibacter arilaitensis]CBT74702.1 putative disulfide bond formation protein [Glutamicibacter arilaitensis Re117]GGJ72420.1 cytochrome C biogenesis protein CcdA [Glutamicibacter ardleyensis]HCH48459.1 cytochrome c biogenesis protein CcdA [Glutamicibacter sp.]HCJ53940.1 cytochrome c biogenesis protein CcdA [Glutamicibacter sp.]
MDIGLLSAFLGGMLALLSPCSALLLPAFFASTVGSGPRLYLHGLVFYLGLALVLVPAGLGVGAVGLFLATERELIVLIASLMLIAMGIIYFAGFGFDLSRWIPGFSKLQHRASGGKGLLKTLALGAVGGVSGFCAGPILGAMLTLAAVQGDAVSGGVLLAVYGAGMVVPMFVLARIWNRLGANGRSNLRGRTTKVFGRELHVVSILTGSLLIVVGVIFWLTNGLISAPQLVPIGVQDWLQRNSAALSSPMVDVAALVVLAVIVFWGWMRRGRKSAQKPTMPEELAPGQAQSKDEDRQES